MAPRSWQNIDVVVRLIKPHRMSEYSWSSCSQSPTTMAGWWRLGLMDTSMPVL
jgi:hypothetical protein